MSFHASTSSLAAIQMAGQRLLKPSPCHCMGRWMVIHFPPTFSGKMMTSRSSSAGLVRRPARIQFLKSLVRNSCVEVRFLVRAAGKVSGNSGRTSAALPVLSQYFPGGKARVATVT